MKTQPEYTVPTAPAGWFLSEYPSVGALVVPLSNTEADLADALARGWRPLLVTKANTRTGRATARTSELEARPVVYSGRGGGGWRQGGRWVWFATPRTPLLPPVADEPSYEAVPLADEPAPGGCPQCSADGLSCPRCWQPGETEQVAEAASPRDTTPAPARPVWLYGAAAGTEGEPTPEGAELADDAPDTTPRPALSVYVLASRAAGAALDRHAASACAACEREASGAGWCGVWTALVRRSSDAADALRGALAVSR